jgi:hypothetical protein
MKLPRTLRRLLIHDLYLWFFAEQGAVYLRHPGFWQRGGVHLQSFGCHQHRQRHLDELFISVYGFQGAAHVVGDIGRSLLLDPVRKLLDGGFQGELISLILNSSEGSRSVFGIANPPWRVQRSSRKTEPVKGVLSDRQDVEEEAVQKGFAVVL